MNDRRMRAELIADAESSDETLNAALDAARRSVDLIDTNGREEQRRKSQEIGLGLSVPMPTLMSLEEMLQRLVFVSTGSQVALRGSPHTVMKLAEFKAESRASVTRNGDRMTPTAEVWLAHPERITVHAMTFRPGAHEFTVDPNGTKSWNLWMDRKRATSGVDADVAPFLDHVAYLVPDDRERDRFLNWLAHIEQRPGVLPHTHYLMVTPQTGIGRNWLASLLARVWAGECRLGFDLMGMLKTGFSGPLSRRTLIVVDELKAEVGYMATSTGQQLKALLTAEERTINPKYGRVHHEVNCARWLMFSQHDDALPLEQYDRRVIVIDNPTVRRPAEYYSRLYALLEDERFVAAVANWFGTRDLANYNPSEPAPLTAAKQRAIDAGLSDLEQCLMHLKTSSTCDLMTSAAVQEHISSCGVSRPQGRAISSAYKRANITPCKAMPMIHRKQQRVVALRNASLYVDLPAHELAAAMRDQRPDGDDVHLASSG